MAGLGPEAFWAVWCLLGTQCLQKVFVLSWRCQAPLHSLPRREESSACWARALPCCCVWLSVTTWAVARQAPLCMGFPRQEYRSGVPFLPQGSSWPGTGLPSPALAGGFLRAEQATWEHHVVLTARQTCLLRGLCLGQSWNLASSPCWTRPSVSLPSCEACGWGVFVLAQVVGTGVWGACLCLHLLLCCSGDAFSHKLLTLPLTLSQAASQPGLMWGLEKGSVRKAREERSCWGASPTGGSGARKVRPDGMKTHSSSTFSACVSLCVKSGE